MGKGARPAAQDTPLQLAGPCGPGVEGLNGVRCMHGGGDPHNSLGEGTAVLSVTMGCS